MKIGHLTVKIQCKPTTNESTIVVEQGNLTVEEYAKAIKAITDYLIMRVKLTGVAEDALDNFKLPEALTHSYQYHFLKLEDKCWCKYCLSI